MSTNKKFKLYIEVKGPKTILSFYENMESLNFTVDFPVTDFSLKILIDEQSLFTKYKNRKKLYIHRMNNFYQLPHFFNEDFVAIYKLSLIHI